MEACPDPIDFPLSFSGGHVAFGRSARDSPSYLSARPLDFPCQPPTSIRLAPDLDRMAENHLFPTQRSRSLMKMKV